MGSVLTNFLVAEVDNPWSTIYSRRSILHCVKQDIYLIAVVAFVDGDCSFGVGVLPLPFQALSLRIYDL